MLRSTRSAALLAAVPLVLSACTPADSAQGDASEAGSNPGPGNSRVVTPTVEVAGMDYAFEAPAEVEAGWTTFRFANRGTEAHHLTLVRLEGGHTVADVVSAMQERRPLKGIATAVGGPNAPMPGAEANATVHLTPGEYALICVIPSPDGVPHLFKGMVKPITVRESGARTEEPPADLQITLVDYAFAIEGSVQAGEQTIRAYNDASASEPHEIVVARLAPGKTVEDVNEWIHAMQGPPPAEFLGGITALDPGHSGSFTIDFTPGEYALLCPLPSADGQSHSHKGMVHQFTVQ
jgi:uncharacterized cupredoxin-like copper-binding protein